MNRLLATSFAFVSLALVQAPAFGQQKQTSQKQVSQKQALQKREDNSRNAKVVKQKFAKIQNDIKRGKVKFIGKKPTFKIQPNPVLKYSTKQVAGTRIDRNIRRIAKEQRRIAKSILSVEEEFLQAAIKRGAYKLPLIPRCADRTRMDWRSRGKVTPVKDQGGCGSCANFAVLGAYEGNNALRNNTTVDGSEQRLLSCARATCNGARTSDIKQYMVTIGTSTEATYPYTATNSACNAATTTPYDAIAWDFVGVNRANPTVRELKNALCTYGPITTTIRSTSTLQAYAGGIFNEANNGRVNHGVTIVGWDDRNGGYWIIKNSWGTDWGENGFARIAFGSNNVGMWSSWIQAPLLALRLKPDQWQRILRERKIPTINRFIRRS